MSRNIEQEIRDLFGEKQMLQQWMDIEAVLARCQADMGIIPQKAAEEIVQKKDISNIDIDIYHQMYQQVKHPLVPLLKLYQKAVGDSGEYLHVGATTHDIVDIAKIISLKKVWNITEEVLGDIESDILDLAENHLNTLMVGRTHNIHALPITFGFKAAIWADEIHRCIERLKQSKERVFVVTFSGAVGSMASFEGKGKELERRIAEEFGLAVPDMSWHPARDRIAEIACVFALVGGTLSRIAQEVYLLMGTEIRELSEGYPEGVVGSSTMPHKINPINSQHIMSDARTLRYDAAHCIECMGIDHEHNLVHFADERTTCERIGVTMADMLSRSKEMIHNLHVDKEHMRKNLDVLQGAILSEHIMLELGKKIGKMSAKNVITELSVKAIREDRALRDILKADIRVNKQFTDVEIDQMMNLEQYAKPAADTAAAYLEMRKGKDNI